VNAGAAAAEMDPVTVRTRLLAAQIWIGRTDPMLRTERSTARARPSQVERGAQGDAHRLYDVHLDLTIRSLMAELMLSSCITPTSGG